MKSRKRLQNMAVLDYEVTCVCLAVEFARKYFGKDAQARWIGNQPGGTLEVNDHYFSVAHIYEAMKFGITRAQLFAWYEDSLLSPEESKAVSLRNWRFIKVSR
jgi:hypothetical protein